jgi:hypothetical protein
MNFEIKDTEVRCDEAGCGWSKKEPWTNIPKWHRKPCPRCGKGQIVNDADLWHHRMISAWADFANNDLPVQTGPAVELELDTAPLRTSNPTLHRGGTSLNETGGKADE